MTVCRRTACRIGPAPDPAAMFLVYPVMVGRGLGLSDTAEIPS
jgi:hypothetical protein